MSRKVICVALFVVAMCTRSYARSSVLTLEERVAAQRRIEEVYWRHRIWPSQNRAPKPPLEVVLPEVSIRAKVEDSLRKSRALEEVWHRPITGKQLQAELGRISRDTRDPRVLDELFDALDRDPALVAETLARTTLVDRLIRDAYAGDPRFHGLQRTNAEAGLAACSSMECMKSVGGDYREETFRLERRPGEALSDPSVVVLEPGEWEEELARLGERLGAPRDVLPRRALSSLEETPDAFLVTAVLSQSPTEVRTATVLWPKRSFDDWWRAESTTMDVDIAAPSAPYSLPFIASTACAADTWRSTGANVPTGRSSHTAVWTGTEMIIWGGSGLNDGSRYNPSTDTWNPTSMGAYCPDARSGHTAIWTGTEMIVWGGGSSLNTGGRYNPAADSWQRTFTIGAPVGRSGHAAVWTGSEMIVWGGSTSSGFVNSGGRYDPSTDTWRGTATTGAPVGRVNFNAVWTGTVLIVWGGRDTQTHYVNTGGRYDPSTDTWSATSIGTGVPTARGYSTAVWTGAEMIVWGGSDSSAKRKDGDRYDPTADTWIPTSTAGAVPTARNLHSAVWTGSRMIVWGGDDGGSLHRVNTGGSYDPSSDTWTATSTSGAVPGARSGHAAVWTGTEMIVWGGSSLNTGGRYEPISDTWIPTSTATTVPVERFRHSAVWTGAEMIVWGGQLYSASHTSSGGRYVTATGTWTPTSSGPNVPAARAYQTAVWTGSEMIVWGGRDNSGMRNDGGRYNPAMDSWTATSTGAGVPEPRYFHTALWTGTEMIVWGGYKSYFERFNTGGRYGPTTDVWTPTSTGANVPIARDLHAAVWTGTRMLVWGGDFYDGSHFQYPASGGIYDPSSDTWTPTSIGEGVPLGRWYHTAVWTGSEMIVWGGSSFDGATYSYYDSGARYAPLTDSWTATSAASAPEGREGHTAAWTGSEMIVWGGTNFGPQFHLNTGSRYDPVTDTWTATPTGGNDPAGRYGHTCVWTGTEMIVWGGREWNIDCQNSGGGYCACPGGILAHRDADGDGYGDPGISKASCDGSIPSGYVADGTDCNDSGATIHPGAVEICDGLDDDCNGAVDDGIVPPSGSLSLDLTKSGTDASISWASIAGATAYDAVEGDLVLLASTAGDFQTATVSCIADDISGMTVTSTTTPEPGDGVWMLVRGNNCGGAGSYDEATGNQQGSRDTEIAASGHACP